FRFLDADDEWVWLEAIGSNRRQTVVEGFVVTSRDITDRLERERQIERERNRFEAAFETVPEPAVHFVYDDETPIVNQVNHAFEEVFGYDRAAAVGKPVDDLVVPVDDREQARDLNREVRESGHLQETVHRVTPSGERPFLFTARTMPTTDDDLEGVATYVDLTEQKRREEALIRQNERLDRFAGIVSHDLRNPLNVAEGHLELAREGGEPGEHLEVVADALDRMTALIDDLLTLARHGEEVGEMEAVALDELATACWGTVESEGADLAVQVERSVYADRTRLRQLLENLLANAITHGGDDVTITIGALEDGFYVEDDGPGIPPEERESVFEAGYSTGDEGTGFGLAIVREIATAHGWAIQVTEGAAGGARFEVTGVRFADGS
ncbi:MAG: ATP-binding protein, partial [Halobacteriota archaeon]